MLQKPGDQSLIPRTHRKVEGENQLCKVVLRPPHACCGTLAYTHTHPPRTITNSEQTKALQLEDGTRLSPQHYRGCCETENLKPA